MKTLKPLFFTTQLAPVMMALAIYIASEQSWIGAAFPFLFKIDYLLHAGIYGGLTLLLFRALYRKHFRRGFLFVLIISSSVAFLFGVADEFHQAFVPNRSPSWSDIWSNLIGIALVCSLLSAQRLLRRRRKSSLARS